MTIETMQPSPYRIIEKKFENADTFTIKLAPVNGNEVLEFSPGQFNMLYAFGVGEAPVSFSGNEQLIHTIKIVGNVTRALSRCEVGDEIGVRGPYGKPWPTDAIKGRNIVLAAGGIGLAPIRSLLYYLLANRADYKTITLLYGARNPEERLFIEELRQWKKELDGHTYISVDVADETWLGNVGVVTSLLPKIPFSIEKSVALLCGPEIMMRMMARELLNKGIASDDIYVSLERNMKCAVGHCGRCQLAPYFICKDGPVFTYPAVEPFIAIKGL